MSLSEELTALATAPASLDILDKVLFELDDAQAIEIMLACEEELLECTDWHPFVIDLCETDPEDFNCEMAALMFTPELLDEETGEYIG